jgi:sulfoquinovose isomerase
LDGQVLDTHKNGYGHAFTLFGLAHSYKCTGDPALQAAMYDTWEVLQTHFRDQHGGYLWRMTAEFESAEPTRSQNPTMHLFEALLTAATVGGAADLFEHARAVGEFVLHKLVRANDRRLPEVYDADWTELPFDDGGPQARMTQTSGGRLDIGHAFEWAFLTSYAAELGFPAHYRNYANSFMTYGLAVGLDWEVGGIYSPSTPTGQLMNQRKGWWEQCEAIRALVNFVVLHQRNDLLEPLQKMISFMQTTMLDPEYGGWYPNVGPGYTPTELEKGNEWKLDYHVVGMCMEAIRLANRP